VWGRLDERCTLMALGLGRAQWKREGAQLYTCARELMEPRLCPDALPGLHLPYRPYHSPLPFFSVLTSFLSFYHISLGSWLPDRHPTPPTLYPLTAIPRTHRNPSLYTHTIEPNRGNETAHAQRGGSPANTRSPRTVAAAAGTSCSPARATSKARAQASSMVTRVARRSFFIIASES